MSIDRSQFAAELADPKIRRLFLTMMQAEVGGYGPEAQAAWAETVFNRAQSQGRSLKTMLAGQRKYWQPYRDGGFKRAQQALASRKGGEKLVASLDKSLDTAFKGSNYTNGATHNYQTDNTGMLERQFHADRGSIVDIGGEKFYRKRFPNEVDWFEKTILGKNPPLAPKDVPLPAQKPNAARDLAGVMERPPEVARPVNAAPTVDGVVIDERPVGSTNYVPPVNPLVQPSYDEFGAEPVGLDYASPGPAPPQAPRVPLTEKRGFFSDTGPGVTPPQQLEPINVPKPTPGGFLSDTGPQRNPLVLPPPQEVAASNYHMDAKAIDPSKGMLTFKTSELGNPTFDDKGQVSGAGYVYGPEASREAAKPKEYFKKGVGYPDGYKDKPNFQDANALTMQNAFGRSGLPSWADTAFGFTWGE